MKQANQGPAPAESQVANANKAASESKEVTVAKKKRVVGKTV